MSFIIFTVAESEVKVLNTLTESKWTTRCILHDDSVITVAHVIGEAMLLKDKVSNTNLRSSPCSPSPQCFCEGSS